MRPAPRCRRRSAMPDRWPTRVRTGAPSLAPSRRFSPSGSVTRAASDDDIARITEQYRQGAAVAVEAGFDCIEIHLGHNYLLSAFLSPKLNRRTDRWGGSLANRARFPRQVVNAVREAVGDQVAVTAKLNMADGVPGGFWLEESIEFARMLESDGGARCHRADRRELALESRCTCSGVRRHGRSLPPPSLRPCGSASGRWDRGSCRTTRSKRPSSCPTPASSSMRSAAPHPARWSQPVGDGRTCTLRGLLVRGHGPCVAARARPGRPVGERARRPKDCASTATNACPPSTAVPGACSCRRPSEAEV